MILDDMLATGKGANLRGFELPKDIDFERTVNDLNQGFRVNNELITQAEAPAAAQVLSDENR